MKYFLAEQGCQCELHKRARAVPRGVVEVELARLEDLIETPDQVYNVKYHNKGEYAFILGHRNSWVALHTRGGTTGAVQLRQLACD